ILESLIPKNEDDYSFATIASNIYIKDIQYKLWNEPTKINYIFKILKKVLYESFDVIIVDTPPDISFPLVQSAYEGMNNFLIVT
ncbi:ParA family protein, partial [Escherichia coli]|uniref:ParA family protein n=1 Tax=Escherichia coli TaxID=562 RepID=UPI0022F037D2